MKLRITHILWGLFGPDCICFSPGPAEIGGIAAPFPRNSPRSGSRPHLGAQEGMSRRYWNCSLTGNELPNFHSSPGWCSSHISRKTHTWQDMQGAFGEAAPARGRAGGRGRTEGREGRAAAPVLKAHEMLPKARGKGIFPWERDSIAPACCDTGLAWFTV